MPSLRPVRRRSRTLSVILTGALAMAGVLVPTAPAAAAVTITATPASPIVAERVTVSGSLGQQRARSVRLQRYLNSAWTTLQTQTSTSTGGFKFSWPAPTTVGTKSVLRIYAPAYTLNGQAIPALGSPTRAVTSIAQTATASAPTSVVTGRTFTVTGTFTPIRTGRIAILQRLDGSTWVEVKRTTQSSTGKASFTTSLTGAGTTKALRVVAAAYNGAYSRASAARSVAVTAVPDTTPPPAPTGLTATAGNAQVALSWSAVTASDLAGYRVYQGTSSTGPWTQVGTGTQTGTTRTVTALTNGTTYWFRVSAIDKSSNQAYGGAVSGKPVAPDTTPPPAPTGLTATAGNAQVALSWAAVTASDLAGYKVYRGTSATGPWTQVGTGTQTGTTRTVTALTNGTAYWFTIDAVDTSGNPARSVAVTATPVAPDTTGPQAPVDVVATKGDGLVSLSWGAATEDDPAVTFVVQQSTSATGPWTAIATDLTATTYVRTGLTNGQKRYFRIVGKDALGNTSAASAVVSATPGQYDGENHCGELTGDETWAPGLHVLACSVVVPAGQTLTLEPGAVIKSWHSQVQVNGTLIANGTATDPVVLTSLHDDTTAGDTNNDADTTTPTPGEWYGITTNGTESSLDLDHTQMSYSRGIVGQGGTLSVTNSTLEATEGTYGIATYRLSSAPTITGNSIDNRTGPPIQIYASPVDLAKLDANTSTGTGTGLFLNNVIQSNDATLPWTGNLTPVIEGDFGIDQAASLTLDPGTTIKARGGSITVIGTLTANGTATDPVVLTSLHDDTTAGDTNNDADTTTPTPGDGAGITTSGTASSLDLDHTQISHSRGIVAQDGNLSVTNSTLEATDGTYAIAAYRLSSAPTITGNSIDNRTGPPIQIYASPVDLAKLDANTSTGTGTGLFLNNVIQSIDATLPWTGNLTPVIEGFFHIDQGATLTLDPGTTIKARGGSLIVIGTLTANGTATDPVVLTSLHDDTTAGDTSDDADTTTPAPGDWAGIGVGPSASLSLQRAVLRHATAGVTNDNGRGNSGVITIESSQFMDLQQHAIALAALQLAPTIRNNSFSHVRGVPIHLWDSSSAIDFNRLDGNTVSADTANAMLVSGTVTQSAHLPIAGDLIPVITTGGCANGSCTGGDLYLQDGVTLHMGPGAVLKSGWGTLITGGGDVEIQGDPDNPVVFTSWDDDAVGGDSTPDTWCIGDCDDPNPQRSGTALHLSQATGQESIDQAVFRHFATAIHVGNLANLTINSTQFAFNEHAFMVDETTTMDPAVASLPCSPPYTSFVRGAGNWYGSSGLPGISTDLSDWIHPRFEAADDAPLEDQVAMDNLQGFWDFLAPALPAMSVSTPVLTNTIPVTLYECQVGAASVRFPVTPVIAGLAPAAPFPALAE